MTTYSQPESLRPQAPTATDLPERVILIHGTFAAAASDTGDAWWQVGSPHYQELSQRLPAGISLADQGEVFHWSGENHERARGKAAARLLNHLGALEKEGRPYHLIGHSHGGSVIWSALRLATTRRTPLAHLRSWSTVGTPFLHHRSRPPWNLLSIAYMLIAGFLLIPAVECFWALLKMPYDLAVGNLENGIVIRHHQDVGMVTSVLRAPILEALRLCGIQFVTVENGIRLGSFVPDDDQSITQFLLGTMEGWLILLAIVTFAYITLLLASWFLRPVLESMRSRWEQHLEELAFERYGPVWLGIWTAEDEAINGLRATLSLSVSFLGKLAPRERVFLSDAIGLLSRPFLWVLAPVYNTLLRPVLDSTIRGVVVRTAQGNNRPSAQVVGVTPYPLLWENNVETPPLPLRLSQRILGEADQHAGQLGPKIRQLLAEPSFTAGLDRFSKELAGRELVHTSYFDHGEVLDLLVANIAWAHEPQYAHQRLANRELRAWFVECKRLVHPDLSNGHDTGFDRKGRVPWRDGRAA